MSKIPFFPPAFLEQSAPGPDWWVPAEPSDSKSGGGCRDALPREALASLLGQWAGRGLLTVWCPIPEPRCRRNILDVFSRLPLSVLVSLQRGEGWASSEPWLALTQRAWGAPDHQPFRLQS